jgi:hypothetical protein
LIQQFGAGIEGLRRERLGRRREKRVYHRFPEIAVGRDDFGEQQCRDAEFV